MAAVGDTAGQNPKSVGNCVTPATLEVTPIFDARRMDTMERTVRFGEEVRLPLSGARRRIEARMVVHLPDPSCAVELRVREASLFDWQGSAPVVRFGRKAMVVAFLCLTDACMSDSPPQQQSPFPRTFSISG